MRNSTSFAIGVALTAATLTVSPLLAAAPSRGLAAYCNKISSALKLADSVVPSPTQQSHFDLSADFLVKANALCEAMQSE